MNCCKVIRSGKNLCCDKESTNYYVEFHPMGKDGYSIDLCTFCDKHDYPWAGIKITKEQAIEIKKRTIK